MKLKDVYLKHKFRIIHAEAQPKYQSDQDGFEWQIIYIISEPGKMPQTEHKCWLPEVLGVPSNTDMTPPNTIKSAIPYKLVYYCKPVDPNKYTQRTDKLESFEEDKDGAYAKLAVNMGNDVYFYGYVPKCVLLDRVNKYDTENRKSSRTKDN